MKYLATYHHRDIASALMLTFPEGTTLSAAKRMASRELGNGPSHYLLVIKLISPSVPSVIVAWRRLNAGRWTNGKP